MPYKYQPPDCWILLWVKMDISRFTVDPFRPHAFEPHGYLPLGNPDNRVAAYLDSYDSLRLASIAFVR